MPAKYGYPQPIAPADPPGLRASCFVLSFMMWMLTAPSPGPLRCRESRRSLYQLCRLSDRMSHPAAETKEGPGQCRASQGLRQVHQDPPPPGYRAMPATLCAPHSPLLWPVTRPSDVVPPHAVVDGDADLTAANEETKTDHRFPTARPRSRAGPDLQPSITPTRAPLRPPA
jgi:hypothetical protein